MSTILQLIPLVILFAIIGAFAWVGYQVRLPRAPTEPRNRWSRD
jgi:hypothetical protein